MKTNLSIIALFALFLFAFGCKKKNKAPTDNSTTENPDTEKPAEKIDFGCESSIEDFKKMDALAGAVSDLNPREESAFDSIEILNGNVSSALETLLACGANSKFDISDKMENIVYSQTEDGKLRNYSWFANGGGTWSMFHCVYQYFIDEKTAKAMPIESYGGANLFYQIEKDKPIYVGFGYTKTCSTCTNESAELFSITGDSLNIKEIISFDARMGNILHFDYNEKTKTIHFAVGIDDTNSAQLKDYDSYEISSLDLDREGERQIPEEGKAIVDSLVWNGEKFIN